jgi:hypothetical protein
MLHKRRTPGALKNEAPMSPMNPMSPVLIGKHTQRLLERCAFFFDEKSTNKRKP